MYRFLLHMLSAVLALTIVVALPAQAQDKSESMSKKTADIVQTAKSAGSFNTLVSALQAGDLVEALKGEGPFTVFAPTDEAFAALPEGTLDDLLKPENKAQLQSILKYHVVQGKVMAKDVTKLSEAETLEGSMIGIQTTDGTVMLSGDNEATVTKTDIAASNGVIHVIDTVLMPPAEMQTSDM
jgi:uncharacterized surface protein with fasciclin (FAS1) repeats